MAPPPKYQITRKLVRKFFDKYLPREPLLAHEESNKMIDCWHKNGLDSPKCKEYELIYDYIQEKTLDYRRKIANNKYPSVVLQTLQKPKYPSLLKGRYKYPNVYGEEDFFRGVR